MNNKAWLKYVVYTVLIISLIFLKEYVARQFRLNFNETFQINFYFVTIAILINIGIGLLLGLEYLVSEIKKDGAWKVNLPKITLMGLPSLYLSVTYFLLYNQSLQKIIAYPILNIITKYGTNFVPFFQLVLGYVVITSFYKHSEE
jgi:hypothetical protein